MSDDLLIADGYTATKTIPAAPGLHPELTIVYRPALMRERHVYRQKQNSYDPAVLEAGEVELLAKYLVSINGQDIKDKDKLSRLRPVIRTYAVNAILGYEAEDEKSDAKNSSGG
jgi:hypothetical protein